MYEYDRLSCQLNIKRASASISRYVSQGVASEIGVHNRHFIKSLIESFET